MAPGEEPTIPAMTSSSSSSPDGDGIDIGGLEMGVIVSSRTFGPEIFEFAV